MVGKKNGAEGSKEKGQWSKKKEGIIFYKLFVARKDSWHVFVQNSTPVGCLLLATLILKTCTKTVSKKQRDNERKNAMMEGKCRKCNTNISFETV